MRKPTNIILFYIRYHDSECNTYKPSIVNTVLEITFMKNKITLSVSQRINILFYIRYHDYDYNICTLIVEILSWK